MTPTQITGIQNKTDAFHAIFSDASLMSAWLNACDTVRDQLARAYNCLGTARAPRFKHRLKSVPSEVVAEIESFLTRKEQEIKPLCSYLSGQRVSRSWTTIWWTLPAEFEGLGFLAGDEELLGVS